jgi:beta-lactamase regulating signal transducer with metallopeptidase domain
VLAPTPNAPTDASFDKTRTLGLLWLCGFLLLSVRVAGQLIAAERLRRRAAASPYQPALTRALAEAGCARDVPVLISLDIDVPLALGVLRPAIIVPASSSEWSEDEWYVVLLHEAAHLARRDLAARATGIAAGLLHWFNPLVPWIRRKLERDAELAADAVVLHAGVRPSRYADVLLSMAERTSWHAAPEPLLTFARAAGLELRIGEVLRTSANVSLMRRSTAMSVTMASALIAAIVGCLQLTVQSTPRVSAPMTPTVDASDWRVDARSALVELLKDPSPQVRAAAAHSLEQMARQ